MPKSESPPAPSASSDAAPLSPALLIRLHKDLLRLRHTEETLAARYREQEMRTPAHFGTGQEAVAVGVCAALTSDDVAYSHHRSHNHYLARGGDVRALAAELYGRVTGCSGGWGGSVHLTHRETGFIVSSAIVGETIAVATGSALAFKMDGAPHVAVSFFGDAAFEEGTIYESMNYAAIHKLPVLFVCENNLYSTESPLPVRRPDGTDFCERARSFRLQAARVDGNDVAAVYEAARESLEHGRAGNGPAFLECMTYRWREHVGPGLDHELGRTYRSREELEAWMERCPVRQSAAALIAAGAATEEELKAWSAAIERDVAAAIDQASRDPWPDPAVIGTGD